MKFNVIRALYKHERALDKGLDDASAALSGDDRLAKSLRAGRIARHRQWNEFLRYARPVNEAKNHITQERQYLEAQAERDISEAVKAFRRK